ncbi:MAG: peptidylprolyl isomerase [Flavobacteriaceae bacterium]|nr:peptidylprolyl isomerase [Flavobacteriaceae bacterium]
MAVLGQIRQRSVFLILVIGMALFAFVISGVFDGNSASTGPGDPIAVVNDEEIDLTFYRQLVENTERSYNLSTMQAVNSVWDQLVRATIFRQEFERLGIDAGREQIQMILMQDERIVQDPRFQNETGFFDFGIFTDYINQLRVENPQAYNSWKIQEENIVGLAKENIYYDLIKSSTGFTEMEGEIAYHSQNDKVNLKFVRLPYQEVPDSLFKVTDADIKQYINKNKENYETEMSRSVRYVIFPEVASEADENQIRSDLEKLKTQRIEYNDVSKLTDTIEGLATTQNITDFIEQYSETPFDSIYKTKGVLANEYADILFGLNPGDIFGPYKDGNALKISRFLDRKKGGSIKASHILVAFEGATRANPEITRSSEEAKKLAQQLYRKARRNPDDFAQLATENSDGPTKATGGDLGFFQEGMMTDKFFDFCNRSRVGKIGLVETEFGFHIIKVTDKEDVVLTADVTKEIVPSEETSNGVFQKTTQFEMESSKTEQLDTIAKNYNYDVKFVQKVNLLDENLPELPRQRNLVQWLFNDETEIGNVKRFSLTNGGYVVAQMTGIIPEGTVNFESVKLEVVQEIMKERKAAHLLEIHADKNSLDALASATVKEIETASAVTQENTVLAGAGTEPYVIGTAFAMDINQSSALIEGNNGVYMIEVTSKEIAEELESYKAYANALQNEENTRINSSIYEALRSSAEIEDNRQLYY